jgi:Na+-transporting methylmalonyl-CoA/oxaloacetate decarboxylase gamma subunit
VQRFSFQTVTAADGISRSIVGMPIVFAALTLVARFIAALPKVLEALNDYLPDEHPHHHIGHGHAGEAEPSEEESIIAALGFVLHSEFQKQQS